MYVEGVALSYLLTITLVQAVIRLCVYAFIRWYGTELTYSLTAVQRGTFHYCHKGRKSTKVYEGV